MLLLKTNLTVSVQSSHSSELADLVCHLLEKVNFFVDIFSRNECQMCVPMAIIHGFLGWGVGEGGGGGEFVMVEDMKLLWWLQSD